MELAEQRLIDAGVPDGGEAPVEVSIRLEELNSRTELLGKEVARLSAVLPRETAAEAEPCTAKVE